MGIVVDSITGPREETAEEIASHQALADHAAQQDADKAARQALRVDRLKDIPANINSVPALRAIVQGIIEELRGD